MVFSHDPGAENHPPTPEGEPTEQSGPVEQEDWTAEEERVADTAPYLPAVPPGIRECPGCAEINFPPVGYCTRCGYYFDEEPPAAEAQPLEIDGKSILHDKYRLERFLGTSGSISSYFVRIEGPGGGSGGRAVLRALMQRAGDPPRTDRVDETDMSFADPESIDAEIAGHDSGDTVPISVPRRTGPAYRLALEYEVLTRCDSPALPKIIDYFVEGSYRFLVTTTADGAPLLSAWQNPEIPTRTKLKWLEQLHDALAQIHEQFVIFPALQPSRLVVDAELNLQIRDISGMIWLPINSSQGVCRSLYVAPELFQDPGSSGLRSDAYSFGAVLYVLHLGRELKPGDFVRRGVPRPYDELAPDAHPTLVRLLGKTFVADVDARFPSAANRGRDPSGFVEVRKALEEYSRAVSSVRYDTAGWSTTGMVRTNNEDCFTISNISAGAGEFRRDIVLICIADGMGGYHGGEVASRMAVATISDHLRQRGLSSALTDRLGGNHPFQDARACAGVLSDAVLEANRRIHTAAMADPERSAMGCTVDAILLVGRQGLVCHVGDSRVYHRRSGRLRQVTRDHTVPNRLVELGKLKPEEVSNHPRRSELSQAIGTGRAVFPDQYVVDLAEEDWLVACSDGLIEHVSDVEIEAVLASCNSAESATRRLINLANRKGGSDNCTVVVAHVR